MGSSCRWVSSWMVPISSTLATTETELVWALTEADANNRQLNTYRSFFILLTRWLLLNAHPPFRTQIGKQNHNRINPGYG